MQRDLAVRWPGTFKGPSSGPATFKRPFISQCHFQGTIQRTDTAHKIALQELDQQTSRSTLQLWCGGTWWSDDLALLIDLTIFLCIRKISWRRRRRQWCWWSATRDVTASQCTRVLQWSRARLHLPRFTKNQTTPFSPQLHCSDNQWEYITLWKRNALNPDWLDALRCQKQFSPMNGMVSSAWSRQTSLQYTLHNKVKC